MSFSLHNSARENELLTVRHAPLYCLLCSRWEHKAVRESVTSFFFCLYSKIGDNL